MRILIWALVAAATLWSGYWFLGARGIEAGLGAWFSARTDEGWLAEASEIAVDGFPRRFETTLVGVEVADPATGVLVALPELRIEADSHAPTRATVIFPPEFILGTPLERITVGADRMRAHFGFVPGPSLTVDDLEADIAEMALVSSLGWGGALDRGVLDVARLDGTEATYDIVFEAETLLLAASIKRQVDRAGVLPDAIDALRLTATVEFDEAWDRRALEDRRPQPRVIDLELAQATWGDLDLRAAGELIVDEGGVPTGRITIKATNWREMIAIAEASGALPASIAGALEQALGFVAGLSGDPNALDAPLDFVDGQVRFGPVPLGPAPYIYLR